MASRLCVILVVLVSVKMMAAQPIFGSRMWCDMMCDDDEDDDDDDYDDIWSIFDLFGDPCSGCPTSSKPAKTKTTTTPPGMQQPFNLVIPPANGMNVTMTNTGSSWLMNFIPWVSNSAAAPAASVSSTAAPATTAAAATAEASNTTAAATTAKA